MVDDMMEEGPPIAAHPLAGWREQVAARLGTEALQFRAPVEHLHADVLRIHGMLLEYLARHQGVVGLDADGGLTPTLLAQRIGAAEREAAGRGLRLPMLDLIRRFRLGRQERDLLTLAVARAVAPGTGQLIGAAHGVPERDLPSVALATALLIGDAVFTPPPAHLFGAGSVLQSSGLIRLVQPAGGSSDLLVDRLVLPSNFVVAYLSGAPDVAEPLVGMAELVRAPVSLLALVVDDTVRRQLEAIAISLGPYLELNESGDDALLGVLALVSGPSGCGKTLAAEAVAGTAKKPFVRLSAARVAAARNPEKLLDAAFVQAGLLDAVICIRGAEALLGEAAGPLDALLAGVRRHRGLVVLTSSVPEKLAAELTSHLVFQVHLERPDAELREQLWESHLPTHVALEGVPDLTELAFRYELTGGQVRNAVVSAYFNAARRRPELPQLSTEDLVVGAKQQLATRLEGAPAMRTMAQGLEAIVLPEETDKSVKEFLDACRHRTAVLNEWGFGKRLATGKGIIALFSGEPGTGKTFCAELLAHELGLALQVVAIPHVMSKWVGETEKNISKLFSHARAQNTLLMFDEADALFTTRVKVERSMDRFSNMEVNLLLQEIDRFEGVVILTTNLETSMDRAFKRRVGFHVKFPLPDERVRAEIWKVLLPPEAPIAEDVDFLDLAECYDLPGGHIKNILIRSAYRARARGQIIDQTLLHEVSEEECRAAGKLFRRSTWDGD